MRNENDLSRRDFIKTSVAGSVALTSGKLFADQCQTSEDKSAVHPPLPTRPLGKTGVEVCSLTLAGHMVIHGPDFFDLAWAQGIRYFDTADCYKGGQSERDIGQWLLKRPEVRKDLFLVSKDHPHEGPQQLLTMIDKRLETLKTDYIDLFFIHGLGPREYGADAINWPKSKELKEVVKKLKKSGKIKFFGFSCHDQEKLQLLNTSAEGGFIDAIMVAFSPFVNPWLKPTDEGEKIPNDMDTFDEFHRALDRCHQAGIGLVSMKELRNVNRMPKSIAGFEQMNYSTHQLVLHAVWSDPRIASVCSWMEDEQQLLENCQTARNFPHQKPFTQKQMEKLKKIARNHIPITGEQLACHHKGHYPLHA